MPESPRRQNWSEEQVDVPSCSSMYPAPPKYDDTHYAISSESDVRFLDSIYRPPNNMPKPFMCETVQRERNVESSSP